MHLYAQYCKPCYKEFANEDLNEEDEIPIDDEDPASEEVDVEDLLTFGITHTLAQRWIEQRP